jgi:L-ascorbate metabolism protein UlaG (beta-lactamase superfamily)
MMQPVQSGQALLDEIDRDPACSPTLWWLGHCGFVLKYGQAVLYIDPYLSDSQATRYSRSGLSHARVMSAPLHPASIKHADLLLCTHAHNSHLDPATAPRLLEASSQARIVLPKSAAGRANSMGIDYLRMITVDAGEPVEFLKDENAIRIDPVPSAHESLDWTPSGGHPYLGYVIRAGAHRIYHAGDCVLYPGLVDRLSPFNVTLALLPISGHHDDSPAPGCFTPHEAAILGEAIGARWIAPMHYGMFSDNDGSAERFIDHMLGHRPGQPFKIFRCGERWAIPDEE